MASRIDTPQRRPGHERRANQPAPRGPLDIAERQFADLMRRRAGAVGIPGEDVHPRLSKRKWTPQGLRDEVLYDPGAAGSVKDAAWRALISRARVHRGDWVTAAIGAALPAMRADLAHLARGYRGEAADLDAEMLTAFLQAAAPGGIDLDEPDVLRRLCGPGRVAVRRLRHAEVRHLPIGGCPRSTRPPRPWGHPDLVLAQAVAAGVITAADAEVIGQTRLEGTPLAAVAAATGEAMWALQRRRNRAETELAAAIHEGGLDSQQPAQGHQAA